MSPSTLKADESALCRPEPQESSPEILRRLTRLSARVLRAPIAHVAVTGGRSSVCASVGLTDSLDEHRSVSAFAARVRRAHRRNGATVGRVDSGLVAAGMPLKTSAGTVVGSLCVVDADSRRWTADDREVLGELAWMVGTELELRSITEEVRRLAVEAEERRRELEAVVEASPLAILAIDRDGNVQTWNRAAQQIFGWSAEEVIGLPSPAVPDELAVECGVVRERALQAEAVTGMRTIRRRKDGTPINVSLSTAPVFGAKGEIVGVIALLADISERVAAEEALRRSEEQRREAQKLEAIGRVAGEIAHDFNNMIGAIRGYGQLLEARLAGDEQKDAAAIVTTADRATALVRQLLAFSRGEPLEPTLLDLNDVVRGLTPFLRKLVGDRVGVATFLDPRLEPLHADASKLEQVIVNLVVNARDAMPQGGTLTMHTRTIEAERARDGMHGGFVELTIADSGAGMDPATKAQAFEPFFTTKAASGGTGLGLATVYGIVTQTGGRIELESEPGAGTTFRILLPSTPHERAPKTPHLTPRQREVLGLLAQGLSTKAIAARLVCAETTARNHVNAILIALGAHSRLEAVVKAQSLGLV